jgi:hypothetical protein
MAVERSYSLTIQAKRQSGCSRLSPYPTVNCTEYLPFFAAHGAQRQPRLYPHATVRGLERHAGYERSETWR